jgi:membrane protease YdiL (CAAX protease family)
MCANARWEEAPEGVGPYPPAPRLHLLLRSLLYFLLLLLGCGAATVAAGLLLALFPGGDSLARGDVGSLAAVRGLTLIYTALAAGALLATWVMTTLVERRPLRTVGFDWDQRASREIGGGMALGVALQTAIYLAAALPGWLRWEIGAVSAGAALFWGLLLFVPAAFFEELTLRGYLLPTLAEAWGPWVSLGVTSLLFGALHLMNPGASPLAFVGTAAAGVMLGLAYLRTGRLWLPWALHVGWNWAQGSLWGLAVSGAQVPSLFRTEMHGPALWTGGAFGPEAGLLGMLAVALGIVWLLRRRSEGTPGGNGTTS